jgi:hypothetical protein
MMSHRPGLQPHWGVREMDFVLLRAEHDRAKERAYVEFRARDEDGGDAIATAIFSYRTTQSG